MIRLVYTILVIIPFIVLASVTSAAAQDHKSAMRTLSLAGYAEVKSVPDIAIVNLGVVSEAETAHKTLEANNRAMERITTTLTTAGIAENDIQTSDFSVQPRYSNPKRSSVDEPEPPRIVGYRVVNDVTVTVRDFNNLGRILDNVVGVGSNRINGIFFSINDPKPLQNKALQLAVKSAIAKAQFYASAADVTLVRIQSITEQEFLNSPRPVLHQAYSSGEAVPIARGEQSVKMGVQIIWEIK